MPSPSRSPSRQALHRRCFDVQVFARDDGLFDVVATLIDTKPRDIPLASGVRAAGEPLHEMSLQLLIDAKLDVLEAQSQTRWMPYPGVCGEHGDVYTRLAGLNLLQGFRRGVQARLAGVQGCTHLTELCLVLPTAVIQALAGVVIDTREGSSEGQPPFQIDRCHALRRDGPVVQTHYPRWYRDGTAQPEPQALPASSSS